MQLLYKHAKSVSLACAIVSAVASDARSQFVPTKPAPSIQQPDTTLTVPVSSPTIISNPFGTAPPNSGPAADAGTTGKTSVINRYQQVQRPAFIPFDPNRPPTGQSATFSAIDLPPPQNPSGSAGGTTVAAQSLIDAIASPLNAGRGQDPKNRIDTTGLPANLPGAGQLLPRKPAGFDPQQLPPNSTTSNSGEVGGFGVGLPLPDLTFPSMATASADSEMRLTGFNSGTKLGIEQESITKDFWHGKLVAVVGVERVLAGDMAAIVEPIINENRPKLLNRQQEIDTRTSLIRQLLPQFTEMKALQQEFFRDIAGNVPPKELKQKRDEVMARASKAFYDKFAPVELFRKHKVDNMAELELKLQENGLSLAIMKNHFLMQILAMQLEDKYVADTFEIPPGEILAYYNANIDKWRVPARAKWRQITIRFDRHPNRAEADNLIRVLGDEMATGGKPFEAVARDNSEGYTADNGGLHDWTSKGSLKSNAINEAIFTLPLRRLSKIIEDDVGLHIIEVLEREEARTQDMSEIQAEIRDKLSAEIREQKLKEFRQKVLDRVPIWTLWPEDIPGSRPLQQAIEDADITQ